MTIENRTQQDTIETVRQAFRAYLPNSDAWLFPNNLWVCATVIGGMVWEIYARIAWFVEQAMPDTATGAFLERWANLYGVQRNNATKAAGSIIVTGVDGTLVPSGTNFTRSDGAIFTTTLNATIGSTTSGEVVIAVEAEDIGAFWNTAANSPLTLQGAITDVDPDAFVDANGIGGGTDVECDTSLRERMLIAMQNQTFIGTLKDWEALTLAYPGVTRAFVTDLGNGYVSVTFMMDDIYPDGIPQPVDVQNLSGYLNDPCIKPLGQNVEVLGLTGKLLELEIKCLEPDTTEIRQSIQDELDTWLRVNAVPGLTITKEQVEAIIQGISSELSFTLLSEGPFETLTTEIFTTADITYT